jgi:hypothetical protein
VGRLDDLITQVIGPAPVADVAVPAGHHLFQPEHTVDTEGSQSFSVVSGTALDQRLSFEAGSVVVDNNTSVFINVPDATKDGTGRFIPPGVGWSGPILGHISRARINWAAPPGKAQPPVIAGEQAQVIFFAAKVPPGFGFAAPIPTVRWNINNLPADGVQATVTKAAAPGVTHIGDSAWLHWVNDSAAAAGVLASAKIIDGVSGSTAYLMQILFCLGGTGTSEGPPLGPGLNYRGTPGNAMTAEFSAGVALTRQSVSLSGYDQ